ncbi:unnamed protein product, partial [Symbiodinium sp. KB8]
MKKVFDTLAEVRSWLYAQKVDLEDASAPDPEVAAGAGGEEGSESKGDGADASNNEGTEAVPQTLDALIQGLSQRAHFLAAVSPVVTNPVGGWRQVKSLMTALALAEEEANFGREPRAAVDATGEWEEVLRKAADAAGFIEPDSDEPELRRIAGACFSCLQYLKHGRSASPAVLAGAMVL